jgi:uncharacterized protein YjbI with pentapeptide repeats
MTEKSNELVNSLTQLELKTIRRDTVDVSQSQILGAWREKYPDAPIADVEFDGLTLNEISLDNLTLTNVVFTACKLRTASFCGAKLRNVRFGNASEYSDLSKAAFDSADLDDTFFTRCRLDRASFNASSLSHCNFVGSSLRATTFDEAEIIYSDFRYVRVDSRTSFKDLRRVKRLTIDRYALACLGPEKASLTTGNLMDMEIVDDAMKLRSQFGGIWTVTHLASIIVFLFPYAWFVIKNWAIASFQVAANRSGSIPLWEALARFIVTGGNNWQNSWQPAWQSFIPFLIVLSYNVARLALLWKTKRLESDEAITGLPTRFSLESTTGWRFLFRITKWGYWVAILLVLANTWHFMCMRIPIGP